MRPDGVALHLFDPVNRPGHPASNRGPDRGPGGGPGSNRDSREARETLVRFIKCRSETTRAEIHDRIQQALQASE